MMSREYAAVAPGRARTRAHRVPAPSREGRSRARAGHTAPTTGSGSTGARALLALGPVVLLAVALLLRTGVLDGSAGGAATRVGSKHDAVSAAQAIDPRLVLMPRTLTQTAMVGGVQMVVTAGPLLPGANTFVVRLAEHGHPLSGAHVFLTARMIGMAMRPVTVPMSEVGSGRYAGTGPLPMFGQWQVTARIDRPGVAALSHQFIIGLDLPSGLLAARGVSQP